MRKFVKKLRMVFKERANDNKGFTFVELLCASVILALIVAPALQLFLFATKTNSKARTELQANITASSVLESARSFSIYLYDTKCNADYSSADKATFTLLPGEFESGKAKTLMETLDLSKDNCYSVEFASNSIYDDNYYLIKDIKKDTREFTDEEKGKTTCPDTTPDLTKIVIDPNLDYGKRCRYAYVIEGIKQTNNTYDAIVMFEKYKYLDLDTYDSNGVSAEKLFSEGDVPTALGLYNKNFKITVFIYKSKDRGTDKSFFKSTGSDENANLSGKNSSLVMITGSKLDPAMDPSEKKQ